MDDNLKSVLDNFVKLGHIIDERLDRIELLYYMLDARITLLEDGLGKVETEQEAHDAPGGE